MVELDWLMMCYAAGRVDTKPLVILYGAETPELSAPTLPANIRAIRQEQTVNRSLRIRDVYPGFEFFHPRFRIQGVIKATVNLIIFNPKLQSFVTKL
jgi:hypothetical protein